MPVQELKEGHPDGAIVPPELALLLPLLLVLERLLRRRRLLVQLLPDVVEELLVPGVARVRVPLEAG